MISPTKTAFVSVGALAMLLCGQPIHASEITGTLTTTVPSTTGDTLTGTVTNPAPENTRGGSGGGRSSSRKSSSAPHVFRTGNTATTTLPLVSTTTGSVLGATTYYFANDLTGGSIGMDVTMLQQVLMTAGYLVIDAPTGYFGKLTRAAVVMYQTAHGLPTPGRVGPLTRAVLNGG